MVDRPLPPFVPSWDEPKPSSAVPVETFDTILSLLAINKALTSLVEDSMAGRPVLPARWEMLADCFATGERACRIEAKPVVPEGGL